eukprot:TRINITY_DN3731_c0_g3_i1.p1 TRINITY_DN3731_c0_g3~~TRINITY_DN3731_c0_g3_i1.p1  ORF type:complete len:318 (-),score=38.27 TRINITY_DN3731_c0_g3_i1:308-1261(-)
MGPQQIPKLFQSLVRQRALGSARGLRQQEVTAQLCGRLTQCWTRMSDAHFEVKDCARREGRKHCSNISSQSCLCGDGNPVRQRLWSSSLSKVRALPKTPPNSRALVAHKRDVRSKASVILLNEAELVPIVHLPAYPWTKCTTWSVSQGDGGGRMSLIAGGMARLQALSNTFSTSVSPPLGGGKTSPAPEGNSDVELRRQKINKILYRSKQRGYLELDLVIGKWADENAWTMDEDTLSHFAELLDEETPDLWKWLTGQDEPSAKIAANPVFASIKRDILEKMNASSSPSTRARFGDAWVRGWEDNKRATTSSPPAGNQ